VGSDQTLFINASCPGGSCTQVININKVSVSGQEPPVPSGLTMCETGANPLGGSLVVTPVTAGKTFTFFDESIHPEWNSAHYTWLAPWLVSSDFAVPGNTYSLKAYIMQQGLSFWRVNVNQPFPASDYTHLQLSARVGAGRGQWSFGLRCENSSGQDLDSRFYGVDSINSPEYCPSCPLDDQMWHLITIPLSDLGLGANLYNNIWQFLIWPTNWEMVNTTLYLDNVAFINAQTLYTANNIPSNNIDTKNNYATDPYTLNPDQNLQIPGVPTLLYGSCPESNPACNYLNNNKYLGLPGAPAGSASSLSGSTSSNGTSPGAIAAIVILVILLVIAVIVIVILVKKGSPSDF